MHFHLKRNAENGAEQEQHNEKWDKEDCHPGNDIEAKFVDMTPHQATIIDQQDNKNKQDGQHGGIQILQDNKYLNDRKSWNKGNEHTQDN